jgi:alpha-maltose-1-phosphate synthase
LVSRRFRVVAVALAAPAIAAVLAAVIGPWPVLAVAAAVWGLFILQLASGSAPNAFVRYARLRRRVLHGPADGGRRRTIGPAPASSGKPTLAWSHDGWAHADGHLQGLELLAEHYDITAFGTDSRARGEPPVTLELLPARPYDEGIILEGLTELLRPFDIVWAGGSFDGTTLQALDARAAGGPAIVCYEVENLVANYGHVRHPIRDRAIREVDHFCAISSAAKAVLELDGVEPERISVVPPVVDAASYDVSEREALRDEGRRRWNLDERDFVVLFMGRAVWEKGLHTIAAAAATTARNQPELAIRWLIAGEGDYLSELHRIVERYGAADRVRTPGAVAGRDRHVAYATADVLVVPSLPTPRWLEQFGRVIPEAFAFGLPVIGSASGAIPEVVGDAGIVVAPADHLALVDAVVRLRQPEQLVEFYRRAKERLAAEYSLDRYAERMAAAIESARAHRARKGARS